MAHRSRLSRVVIDAAAADHDAELAFWNGALGVPMETSARFPEYHSFTVDEPHFGVLVQRLGDGPARVHVDFHTDDVDAEVARLEALGATRVEKVHLWWIMRDPAGLTFCVVPAGPGELNEHNSRLWEEPARGR